LNAAIECYTFLIILKAIDPQKMTIPISVTSDQ
jgi:hypothetical protein